MLRQIIRAGNLSWSSYLKTESIKQVPQFPLRIYFKSFTSKLNDGVRQFQLFCPWMKSYGLTIQTKSLQQHFHKVLFIQYVVLTFESVDEILQCNHSNEPLQQYFHMVLFIQYVVLTFESVDQILQCDHSIVIQFLAELSLGTFCFFPWCIFSHKVGKIRSTFTLANSGSEEMSKLVLQSKMGRTVSVSDSCVRSIRDWSSLIFICRENPRRSGNTVSRSSQILPTNENSKPYSRYRRQYGMAGEKPQESRVVYFPTLPRLLRRSAIISDIGKLKKVTVVDVGDRQEIVNFCLVKIVD